MVIEVSDAKDLAKVGTGEDGWDNDEHYVQTDHIDCLGEQFPTDSPHPVGMIGCTNTVIDGVYENFGAFTGTYDGNGYYIYNLYLKSDYSHSSPLDATFGNENMGLFSIIADGAEIKNVGLIDPIVDCTPPRGSYDDLRRFEGAAPVVGKAKHNAYIYRCFSLNPKVTAKHSPAGVVARIDSGENEDDLIEVEECFARNADLTAFEASWLGGIAGTVRRGDGSNQIKNCYATGKGSAQYETGGGVLGQARENTTLINCYAAMDLELGLDRDDSLDDRAGPVLGRTIGEVFFENNYFDSDVWDIIECLPAEVGDGYSTSEMYQQDSFEPEWDFEDVWSIEEGVSYPYLQYFNPDDFKAYNISGKVTLEGDPVSGAHITLLNMDTRDLAGAAVTDSDGEYEIQVYDDEALYHVICDYEDSDGEYNTLSFPFVEPVEEEH